MNIKLSHFALIILLSIANITSAATWWDTKNLQRLEDGCIEYSLQINNFMNRDNGDIFSGIVVMKYGKHYPYRTTVTKIPDKTIYIENSVVALKGTINGKDITNIPLYRDVEVRHVAHENNPKKKCFYSRKGTLQRYNYYDYFDKVVKKKNARFLKSCGCPIVFPIERERYETAENKTIWSMIDALNGDLGINLSYHSIKIDEKITSYLEPSILNGTYVINGEVHTVSLYEVKNYSRTVYMFPLKSVYENAAIFQDNLYYYYVYKEGDAYKIKRNSTFSSNFDEYIKPTAELINYAEIIAKTLGININH